MYPRPPRSTLLPSPTLFRSGMALAVAQAAARRGRPEGVLLLPQRRRAGPFDCRGTGELDEPEPRRLIGRQVGDRKSTRLNSSHANISYAVFCLKKKVPSPAP